MWYPFKARFTPEKNIVTKDPENRVLNGVSKYLAKDPVSDLGAGQLGQVTLNPVQIEKGGRTRRALNNLAVKKYDLENSPGDMGYIEKSISGFKVAKEAGLPVPTTYRYDESVPGFIMTDLTENGRYYVSSGKSRDSHIPEGVQFPDSLTMDILIEKMLKIVDVANKSGISLHSDAFFCIWNKDGLRDIKIGDFDNVERRDRLKDRYEAFQFYIDNFSRLKIFLNLIIDRYFPVEKQEEARSILRKVSVETLAEQTTARNF